MKYGILLAMTVMILAGSWEGADAQASKPAKAKKSAAVKPAEATIAVETAVTPAAAAVDTAADSLAAADSAVSDTTPQKKKKGLFGKAKGVMKNKVVQTVVKTAACTMVPGGSAIVGAIDAASSKSVGEAASGAAGAASGASCMPGMGGAGMGAGGMAGAGMAAAGMGGGGLAGLAGAGLAGAAMPGGAGYAPGMPAPGMMPMGAYGMGGDPKPMADCMGLTLEEYNALTNPTGGQPRQATKAEMKRMEQLSKKVGSQRQMGCSQTVGMQQASAQMAQMQQMMAAAQQQGMSGMARQGMPGAGATMSEAPGEEVLLAADLASELKKGKTVVRGIDWVAGSAEVSPAGRPGFDEAMGTLGQAIKASGQRYRLDLYMDERHDDAAVQTFGPSRLQLVQSSLTAVLGDPAALQIGKTKRDKNPRLELVKTK